MAHMAWPKSRARLGTGKLTGWQVLAIALGFFGTVAAANAALVYYALSTFSGEEEVNPYQHGLDYDRDIAAARAQDELHWQVEAKIGRDDPQAPAAIEITMHDAQGSPLTGLALTAQLEFPADKRLDRTADLAETEPGVYRAATPARAGQWDLVILAKRDGAQIYRSRNRIVLH